MYIRYVTLERNKWSQQETGLFIALDKLFNAGVLYQYEVDLREDFHNWFSENLLVPSVLSDKDRRPATPKALSWFRDTAKEHIRKMRAYSEILQAHEVPIKRVCTSRPGRVLYEDDFQVVAIPYSDTFE